MTQRILYLSILNMTVTVDKEEILPSLPFAGSRFNLRHVDTIATKGGQRAMKCTHLVGDADHDTGAVMAGRRAALSAQHEEPRGVGRVVLNVVLQHLEPVLLGGQDAGYGRSAFFTGRHFRGTGV